MLILESFKAKVSPLLRFVKDSRRSALNAKFWGLLRVSDSTIDDVFGVLSEKSRKIKKNQCMSDSFGMGEGIFMGT